MRPINKVFRLTERDNLEVIHLGSQHPVLLWMTQSLFITGSDCLVMVSGRAQDDGFLPVKIKVSGKLAYPAKGLNCLVPGMSVSLEFQGVNSKNIKETFMCDERNIDRVHYARYKKALEFAANDAAREVCRERMTEIKVRWSDAP